MPAETFDPRTEPGPDQPGAAATLDQFFPVGEQCRLVLENPRGRVTITVWDRPDIHIRATKIPKGSSLPRFNATEIEVHSDGGTVYARTILDGTAPFRDRGLWDDFVADAVRSMADLIRNTAMPAAVIYDVQVPRHTDLELKAITSETSIEGVRGVVHANSVSGPTQLARVQGDVTLSSVSGNLAGTDLQGYLDAHAVSGSIRAGGDLEVVKANCVSGSIELAGPLDPNGSYDFHTVSGSLTLRLPADASATIGARGVSLAVTSDLPCQVLRDARAPGSHKWLGQLHDGAASLSFRTVSGHLYLAALAKAAEPAPEEGSTQSSGLETAARESNLTASSQVSNGAESASHARNGSPQPSVEEAGTTSAESEQLRILRAIEQGDLAVDEGLRQLEALRGEARTN